MIQQSIFNNQPDGGALFSECRYYRYALWRIWDHGGFNLGNYISFIGLNPSTATEYKNDNTVSKCIKYSKRWGYSGMFMLNAYAFRTPYPALMKACKNPIGDENDRYIKDIANRSSKVVLAWGNDCAPDRQQEILNLINKEIFCLGINKNKSPKHPLYLKQTLDLIPYET